MCKKAPNALIPLLNFFLFAQILMPAQPQAAQAAGLKDLQKTYTHSSQGEPLAALLSDFAISQGYSAAFTSRVEGTVNGEFSDLPPQSF
ncbi:MAG: hypothetical protein FWF99_05610, partial [Desulfovibrionaceae bacterium]|nr:hypothetical protein [Desulfovibrionaceae bacterium]